MTMVANSLLFEALEKLRGDVIVASEGDLGSYHIQDAESSFKGARKIVYGQVYPYGEKYLVNCEVCGDLKHRLAVCYTAGTSMPHPTAKTRRLRFPWRSHVHCIRNGCCQDKLIKELLAILPPDYDTRALSAVGLQIGQQKCTSIAECQIEMPRPSYALEHPDVPPEALAYLVGRGFDPGVLSREYQCRYLPPKALYDTRPGKLPEDPVEELRTWDQRLLIPCIQQRKLMAWQLRALVEGKEPKYLNPLSKPDRLPKGAWVYNFDVAARYREVLLFEGVTNVWRFGPASVALFGKVLFTDQLTMLKAVFLYDGLGVVCLDEDTYPKNRDLLMADVLRQQGCFYRGVAVLRLRGGDAAKHQTRRLHQLFWLACEKASTVHGAGLSALLDEQNVPPLAEDVDVPAPAEMQKKVKPPEEEEEQDRGNYRERYEAGVDTGALAEMSGESTDTDNEEILGNDDVPA